MSKNYLITVIGTDGPGIVAQVSSYLWKQNINIEEIKQGIIKGNFFMVMYADLKKAEVDLDKMSKDLEKLGKKINLKIKVYNQEIFESMNMI